MVPAAVNDPVAINPVKPVIVLVLFRVILFVVRVPVPVSVEEVRLIIPGIVGLFPRGKVHPINPFEMLLGWAKTTKLKLVLGLEQVVSPTPVPSNITVPPLALKVAVAGIVIPLAMFKLPVGAVNVLLLAKLREPFTSADARALKSTVPDTLKLFVTTIAVKPLSDAPVPTLTAPEKLILPVPDNVPVKVNEDEDIAGFAPIGKVQPLLTV